ncbi:hypothetical protein G4Y79_01400 [Phototrophicus methaneseepsis]|uniref:Uncharacterized protein n=1 Tax=Phototrophicus methaneseepsis TaxID=2710758 RepID=A0A7S8E9X9_9CHLR|nr:hypothetical protein [Phototrophicus methaneseepsis]QPC83060.1 hypothetical protein G4Y79_01400 [Phototrophicus methaneseepsis]
MTRRTDPKAQIASAVSILTITFMWPALSSFEQFTMLFEGNSTNLFMGTLFLCVTIASIVGGIIYAFLANIERI